MLVGNSQTLCDLHRTAAGCAFLPNAFLMEFMIQWYIRWAQTHLKEKVPTMILSAPTVTYLLLFDVRYVIDICVQNIGCGFLLPRCKTAQLPVQLIICHICITIVIFLYKDVLSCYNSRIYGHRTTGKEYLMARTADTIAIYSRKSRYTGKGESIGNQIDLCREYIRTHYGDAAAEHAVVFEDEGFSGGNLNRPDFKKMMTAAKDRKFKAIVVYRLDRISRNISDFSSLIEELGRLGIDFVSIRESFDTSSPMGRAMMYIASVFSQLERETIAERIRDNMHELAKTGRWLGGTTPTGYASESVKSITVDGKTKKACKLKLQKEGLLVTKRNHFELLTR